MSLLLILLAIVIIWPQVTEAIVPPEFILTVGSNLLQILGIIALVIFSIYSALAIFIQRGYALIKTYTLPIIVVINIIAGGILSLYIKDTDNKMNYTVAENEYLRTNLLLAQNTIDTLNNDIVNDDNIPNFDCGLEGICQAGKKFYSYTYVLVAKDITLELDINHYEIEPYSGVYNHYAYLNGTVMGNSVTDYLHLVATSTDSFSHEFLQQYKVVKATDLSARASHTIALILDDLSKLEFSTVMIDDDFITKNSPALTRTHSVSTTTIYFNNESLDARVYIEKTYSDDADYAIFFPGRDKLEVKTAQFIFWDSANNFYLFDNSNIVNPVPQYQSHTWLLMKNKDGTARKSYTGSYNEILTGIKLGWLVTMPGFNNATIEITASEIFKSKDNRLRVALIGSIKDNEGIREVVGVGHLIQ